MSIFHTCTRAQAHIHQMHESKRQSTISHFQSQGGKQYNLSVGNASSSCACMQILFITIAIKFMGT